jgi:aryl-alcohol dehydrogenase-like predicted oxidoreductase
MYVTSSAMGRPSSGVCVLMNRRWVCVSRRQRREFLRQEVKPDPTLLANVATRHQATTAQIALAWLLAISPATLAIPGTSSLDHLTENIAAADLRLTADDLAELAK